MRFINETRVVQLPTRAGGAVEGRERVVGVDARFSGRGVMIERHIPIEVVATTNGNTEVVAFENDGPVKRLVPYLAAPAIALIVKQLFRAKG